VTWNTTSPDFTPCFEKTALTWGSCGFLWVFAGMDLFYSVTSRARDIPRSPLSVSKFMLTYVLIAAELAFLYFIILGPEAEKFYHADLISSSVKLGSYVSSSIQIRMKIITRNWIHCIVKISHRFYTSCYSTTLVSKGKGRLEFNSYSGFC